MDTEPPRHALDLGVSAFGGAAFWGIYHLASLWRAGSVIEPQHVYRAIATILAGIVMGVLAAVFLGPALIGMVPVVGLRNAYVVGFAIGAGSFEAAPFVFGGLRKYAAKKAKEAGQ